MHFMSDVWTVKLLLQQLLWIALEVVWRHVLSQCVCLSVCLSVECLSVCVPCQTLQTVASTLLLLVGLYLLRCLQHYQPFAVFGIIYGHAAVDIVVFAVSIYAVYLWSCWLYVI